MVEGLAGTQAVWEPRVDQRGQVGSAQLPHFLLPAYPVMPDRSCVPIHPENKQQPAVTRVHSDGANNAGVCLQRERLPLAVFHGVCS